MSTFRGELLTAAYDDASDCGDDEECEAIEEAMFDLFEDGLIELTYDEAGRPRAEDI